jgi:putative peptidoglycan lipid II flippase
LVEGSVNVLSLAQQFMNLPIGIFATAIAMAIFPTMTQQAALNDFHEFKRSLSLGIRSVAFICIPSAVGLIVLREPILRLLFEFKGGQFMAQNTVFTAQALLYYSIGLTFYGIVLVLARGFYAQQITITPVIVSLITMLTNYIFSHLLVGPMAHRGLALAFSIAGMVQCGLLFVFLRRRIGQMDLRHILDSFMKTGAVCLIMGLTVWGADRGLATILNLGSKIQQVIHLGACVAMALPIFFGLAYFMRMEEAKIIIDMFKRRLRHKNRQTAN